MSNKESLGNTRDKIKMNSLQTDLLASALVGILATLFATIVVTNLNINISFPVLFAGFLFLCVAGIVFGRFIGKKISIAYNFLKFGEAGGLNWLMDLGVFNMLVILTGINSGIYFTIFKGISFAASATNSYFWNKFWVFEKGKTKVGKEVTKFVVATIAGMIFNVLIASVIRFVGPTVVTTLSGNLWANIAVIAGSLSAMLFNFILYRIWVFK